MDAALLQMLACPGCRGELILQEKGLACRACGLLFPITDGIPVLLLEEALPLESTDSGASAPES